MSGSSCIWLLHLMDLFIYSDESGVFDPDRYDFFVFGGLMFFSSAEAEDAARLYQHAEKLVKKKDGLADDSEPKASNLTFGSRYKLFRALNHFHKFAVVVHQKRVLSQVSQNKKSKQRYLDYVFKIAVKREFESLLRNGAIKNQDVHRLRFFVDEHATATDGRYELREALEREFKWGTFNYKYSCFYPPIFSALNAVELKFCDSKVKPLIRAADIVANRVFNAAIKGDLVSLKERQNMLIIEQP